MVKNTEKKTFTHATGSEPVLMLEAYPTVHHHYPHTPVIRIDLGGRLVGYGQFTTSGGKTLTLRWDAPEIVEPVKEWVESLLDKYPETRPVIIRLKTSKGPVGRGIAESEQNFLVDHDGQQGVFDIHGTFFPLEETDWEKIA